MKCLSPYITIRGWEYPCRKCIACRINRASIWAARINCELPYWDQSMFLTLTYEDNYLPKLPNGKETLDINDLKKFHKLLRYHLTDQERNIKYYSCGEYGEDDERPHYHGIYFGIGKEDYLLIKKIWGKGFITLEAVIPERVNYVTRYITENEEYKTRTNGKNKLVRYPCFNTMSQGIGEKYINENIEKIINDGYLQANGKCIPIAQSLKQKYGIRGKPNWDDVELIGKLDNWKNKEMNYSEYKQWENKNTIAKHVRNKNLKSRTLKKIPSPTPAN